MSFFSNKDKCIVCGGTAKIRGNCQKHYRKNMHLVESGKADEAYLVSKGFMLPSNKGIARKRDNKIFRKRSKTQAYRMNPTDCGVPSCTNKQSRRGLCNTHRVYAKNLIRDGKATEANLVNRGFLTPKKGKVKKKSIKKITKKKPVKKIIKKSRKIKSLTRKNPTVKVCQIRNCNKSPYARKFCRSHYDKFIRKSKT